MGGGLGTDLLSSCLNATGTGGGCRIYFIFIIIFSFTCQGVYPLKAISISHY